MTLASLVESFAASVIGQDEATRRANPTEATRQAERLLSAFDGLRAAGDPGREALTALLAHTNGHVRVQAAACLLRYCHDRARAVLEAEAKGRGLLAFTASQALARWEDGTWDLDPDD
jgi:hypothetical protein